MHAVTHIRIDGRKQAKLRVFYSQKMIFIAQNMRAVISYLWDLLRC